MKYSGRRIAVMALCCFYMIYSEMCHSGELMLSLGGLLITPSVPSIGDAESQIELSNSGNNLFFGNMDLCSELNLHVQIDPNFTSALCPNGYSLNYPVKKRPTLGVSEPISMESPVGDKLGLSVVSDAVCVERMPTTVSCSTTRSHRISAQNCILKPQPANIVSSSIGIARPKPPRDPGASNNWVGLMTLLGANLCTSLFPSAKDLKQSTMLYPHQGISPASNSRFGIYAGALLMVALA
jgi:hypothetical protein